MKILVAVHNVMDLGGIINHTEHMIGGLKSLGHEVDLKEVTYSQNPASQRKTGDFKLGPSGIPHNQGKGWNFSSTERISYKGARMLEEARRIIGRYDLVIWQVPVPGKSAYQRGNDVWPELYDNNAKNIAFIHDGNAIRNYPYIKHIEHHLDGVACVHHCALAGSDFIAAPRKLILNPQLKPIREVQQWNLKNNGFINMQTFKAWKRAHELVKAISFLPSKKNDELREVAGEGIEYRYMTSVEKCKDQYFFPDGSRIWESALANGMTHHGYWNAEEAWKMLVKAKIIVDPSWSIRYSQKGGHYNRVVVEGMIAGCVPVARSMGMGDELFRAGEHYVEIPEGCSDQEYADTLVEAWSMGSAEAAAYREAQLEILPRFDRNYVAEQIIELANGEADDTLLGGQTVDLNLNERIDDILFNHFGIL